MRLKNNIAITASLLFSLNTAIAQVNPKNVEIIRDTFGVPHIYAKTDAGAAYGLAWANAEDDFETMQLGYLAGNALLSKHLGLKGASADFVTQLIQGASFVEANYEAQVSEDFKKVLDGFCDGLNAYAKAHPKEVLVKSLLPFTPKKLMTYTYLQLFVMSDADKLVAAIASNQTLDLRPKEAVTGSNTFAFNATKTQDGSVYLAINPHQPLEGPTGWYEAHLNSEEGTNIVGALFPGAPVILIGSNDYLGWSHTVNKPDKADIFELEMDPDKKDHYMVDAVSYPLEKFKAKVFLKFLGLRIGVKKKFYRSIFGPTLKNKSGVYAVRTASLFGMGAIEQWWRMNKAHNFSEFHKALEPQHIPGFNISYADRNDTIYYVSNAKLPIRAKGYDWQKIVPGNTKKTLWKDFYSLKDMPQQLQPSSGYVYNTNHSPFISAGPENHLDPDEFNKDMGFERFNNNRSARFQELISGFDKVSYEDFLSLKYDNQLPSKLQYTFMNINALFEMDPTAYPEVASLVTRIQNWDRKSDPDSKGAGAYAVFYYLVRKYVNQQPNATFSEASLVPVLLEVKDYMNTYFGSENIALGDFIKVVRGDLEMPSFGLPDVLTAMHGAPYKEGRLKVTAGESYIQLVRFTSEGASIRSMVPYGSSNRPNSPHYADQLPLYMKFQTKAMPLDRAYWEKEATRKYHPIQ